MKLKLTGCLYTYIAKKGTVVFNTGNEMFGFDEKKKKILAISFFVYAIVMLLAIITMNFEKFTAFTTWLNDKLDVFTPIFLGAIIAYLCNPLVKLFQRVILKRIKNNVLKRGLSILGAYLFLLAVIIIIAFMIVPQLVSSVEDLVRKMTDGTYMNYALDSINNFLSGMFAQGDETFEFIDVDKINNIITNFFVSSEDILQQGLNIVVSYASRIFTGVKNIFFGLLLSIYFVISKERLYAQSKKIISAIFSKKKCESILGWCSFADKTFGGFIIGKIIDAAFMIFACSIAFSIAKVPYAILISVVIGVCNIVPFFGPFIGAIPSGLIILIADPTKFIIFVILTLLIQQFDANVVEPKIVGDRTGLSSLGVIVAIMIMSGYFGIIGMFFGVPIFAILYSLVMSFVDKRLVKKELATDLAEYYSENSIVDPKRNPDPVSVRIYRFVVKLVVNSKHKIISLVKNRNSKKKTKGSNDQNIDITNINVDNNSSDDDSDNGGTK